MNQRIEPLAERSQRLLGAFAHGHGFSVTSDDEQPPAGRGWVRLESASVVLDVVRDRGEERFEVAAKAPPGPGKPRRSWPLGHVLAYLDGADEPYDDPGLEVGAEWLTTRAGEILDPEMLNSEGLRRWAVKASRRTFGQGRRR